MAEELSLKGILEIFILIYAIYILTYFQHVSLFFLTAGDTGFIDPTKDLLTPERGSELQANARMLAN